MKYPLVSLVLLFVAAATSLPGYGQTIDEGYNPGGFDRVAQTGWQFLKLPTHARYAGMAGIASAVGYGTAGSALANPASIADISGFGASFSRMNWIADISYNAGALVKEFGRWGYAGVSIIYVDYGSMERTENQEIFQGGKRTGLTEVAMRLGSFGAHSMDVGLVYARNITDRLQVGGTVSYVQDKLDDASMSGWHFNIGTVFQTGLRSLRISMIGRNFGPDTELAEFNERLGVPPAKVKMPMSFTLGGAVDLLEENDVSPHRLTLASEFIHPNDGPEKINVGTEYSFRDFLNLRGGYRFRYDEEGLTLGGGIDAALSGVALQIDYGYWTFGRLGGVHMVSLGVGL